MCMQKASTEATSPAAAPRRWSYRVVDPRCEWSRDGECDTLIVDVSGFKKEELKVQVNTCGKLKVSGERHEEGNQWARFVKEFRIPRSCDARAVRAMMNRDRALLSVILPKKVQLQPQPQPQPQAEEEQRGSSNAIGSSSKSSSFLSESRKNPEADEGEKAEPQEEHGTDAAQDVSSSDAAIGAESGEGSSRWWRKIRALHVLGLVLILALVGASALMWCSHEGSSRIRQQFDGI